MQKRTAGWEKKLEKVRKICYNADEIRSCKNIEGICKNIVKRSEERCETDIIFWTGRQTDRGNFALFSRGRIK